MIALKNIKLENGLTGEHIASLVYEEAGINPKKRLELMECRSSNYRIGYVDLYYRIGYTSNLLLFTNIGSDSSLMKIAFKSCFFEDRAGYVARCKRLAQKYRKYGITYDFVYAFSDSEGVILTFINRMKSVQHCMKAEINKKLLNPEIDTEYKRKLMCKILGDNLTKRSRLESKEPDQVEVVATFIGTKY